MTGLDEQPDPSAARQRLQLLVGEWREEALLAGVPAGRCTFEWALDGAFLLQRSEIPESVFPSSLAVITPGEQPGDYLQHYFDSRGVVRLYQMTLADRTWTLRRTARDFSPLDFSQRFEGTISGDGRVIDGRWETSEDDGEHWRLDFGLRFTRVD